MVGRKKNKSINNSRKKMKSKKMVVNNKKKSRKLAKSKKYEINNTNGGNISGFIHQIQCTNNTCSEYKQHINSFDDLNKLFGLFKI